MIDITQDTQPLTTLGNNSAELLQQLKATQRPIILTADRKPEAILQDPAAYQRLLDLAALADEDEAIRQGLEDLRAGRTRPPGMSSSTRCARNMTYRVDIGAHAQRDLDRIYRHIQAEFSDQAAQSFNQLHVSLASLSGMPYRHTLTREDLSLRHLLYRRNLTSTQ